MRRVYVGLLAVACDDFTVHVVDMEMRRIVRHFSGHSARVTDMVCDGASICWCGTVLNGCHCYRHSARMLAN
jgi:CDGSH-type Zn-finger protein